jgi:hypothetical protein
MAGLVPAIHAFLAPGAKGVDARDIRAFTPVFDGLLRGHDEWPYVSARIRFAASSPALMAPVKPPKPANAEAR